jgi:hypothetical protein
MGPGLEVAAQINGDMVSVLFRYFIRPYFIAAQSTFLSQGNT